MNKTFTTQRPFNRFFKYACFMVSLSISPWSQTVFAAPSSSISFRSFQETVLVKGRVLDEKDGQPLPGVSITNDQKKVLAVTNNDGVFSLQVPKGSGITFNMLGYTASKRVINSNDDKMIISLQESSSELNEVVVTALGIKRAEKSLGYSVTKIDSNELTDAVSSNWTDALSGKVAGLNLVRSNGGPAGSNKIILRGENNLTGDNEALVVVDGVVINGSSGRRSANFSDAVYGTGSDNIACRLWKWS